MKPAPFKYFAAESIDAALQLKAEYGEDAKFLAGGQSLMPAMAFRLALPEVLIDINPIAALAYVTTTVTTTRIGALTRYRSLERHAEIARSQPLMTAALPHIAHVQIRNRTTIGGNLAHADPASEMPAVMLALDARMQVRSQAGQRVVAAQAFFAGTLSTALLPTEMLIEVEVPIASARTGVAFLELARRPGDFAMMGVAVTVQIDEDDRCIAARMAYCNAGDVPLLAIKAAQSLIGERVSDARMRDAGVLAQTEIRPLGNVHATPAYQRHLAGVLTRRALAIACERARAGEHA
ncbi:MAG: xanthine dehydrogenase family protein subunit M [Betaproteobacteria bacterium]|nr:xanthine dehydrogenase family protein subunit M [Betaproteobacteria bacterium]